MTDAEQFDLFVIGAGSAGVRVARMAAARGVRVTVAELAPLGGTCVNLGCIPKKLYSIASQYADDFEQARGYGWLTEKSSFDWNVLKLNRAREIRRLNVVYDNMLVNAGVRVLKGTAHIVSSGVVEVAGKQYRADQIVIATGAKPALPEFSGAELAITSNEIFDLPSFPAALVVIGGGYIACEFSSIFNGLGAQVTQLCRGPTVLRGFDLDVRAFLMEEMRKKGVLLHTECDVARIERNGLQLRVFLRDGSVLVADQVLCAIGRIPNVAGLQLEEAGVAMALNGAVIVDNDFRTSSKGIYALGDVIDRVQLTPVALAEAMSLVDHLFEASQRKMDYELIPTAVFTHPSIGTVGLTEQDARNTFANVTIYRGEFRALRHSLSAASDRTLMKLVVDRESDRVVGMHMVGDDACEIIQGFALAMKAGVTKKQMDACIGIHPTVAEEFVTMREPVLSTLV